MDPGEKKALEDIEKYGCHILHILEESDLPRFTYSIGIEKSTGQPELIVTGLKRDLGHWMINEYNARVRDGETFEQDGFYGGFLEDFQVTFKLVEKKHYDEYFGWAKMALSRGRIQRVATHLPEYFRCLAMGRGSTE